MTALSRDASSACCPLSWAAPGGPTAPTPSRRMPFPATRRRQGTSCLAPSRPRCGSSRRRVDQRAGWCLQRLAVDVEHGASADHDEQLFVRLGVSVVPADDGVTGLAGGPRRHAEARDAEVMPNGPVPVVQVRELVDLVETRNRMLGHESPSSRSDHRHRNWAVAHPGPSLFAIWVHLLCGSVLAALDGDLRR